MKEFKVLVLIMCSILFGTIFANNGNVYAAAPKEDIVIVLDPGHGESDPGAIKNGITERDMNLKIAYYVRDELIKYPGVKVYLTRNTNEETRGLYNRVAYAKSLNAAVLVSLHCNSSETSSLRGAEVLIPGGQYKSELAARSYQLGNDILSRMQARGLLRSTSGEYGNGLVKRYSTDGSTYENGSTADYYGIVRHSINMDLVGIIVEHAYISNASDAALLKNDNIVRSFACADAEGIAAFLGLTIDPDVVYEGYDYSPVFNKNYYMEKYPDIKAAIGDDGPALLKHFIDYGMSEGRKGNEDFNLSYYMTKYPDLKKQFGSDIKQYYIHYVKYGYREGRFGENPAVYQGTDYSAVYNYQYYSEKYSDLKTNFADDPRAYIAHFVKYGMAEGRRGSDDFNLTYYKNTYTDLQNAFGDSKKLYYTHYMNYGTKEGRTGESTTVYKDVDYQLVYDKDYYLSKYADLQNVIGDDSRKLIKHFVEYGMGEGRKACEDFDVNVYRQKYPDLEAAYGSDLTQYEYHYMTYGYYEGRNCE